MSYIKRVSGVFFLAAGLLLLPAHSASAADYTFPIIGDAQFSNDFYAPRANNTTHYATDIFANKMQKIVSRTDGVITFVGYPQPSWGFAVAVKAENGYEYWYLHLNNDTPGTDDGKADANFAYGPDIVRGKKVVQGQLLGYVGDSGNAEPTPPHLHLEVIREDDSRVNAYDGLVSNSNYIRKPVLTYPIDDDEILPSSPKFTGGYSVALGDVDGDGDDELITGPGKGGKQVKIIQPEDKSLLSTFEPNGSSFLGGVDVAAGDIDGDGIDEIITGAGPGGKLVKVFALDGTFLMRIQPNGPSFYGGVDVAAGDIDGDGIDEIITGAGPGGKLVKVFSHDGTRMRTINPYNNSTIGVTVATGNFDSDTKAEIITGAREGGGPRVNIYDDGGELLESHYVYRNTFKGGIRVESGDVDPGEQYDEVITISQYGGLPHAKITASNGRNLGLTSDFAQPWWEGYYDIAAGNNGNMYSSMGINRRSTIRAVTYEPAS